MVLLDMKIYNNQISTNVFLNCMITYIVVFTHFLRDIKIIKTKKNHLKYFKTCQLVCKKIPHTVYQITLLNWDRIIFSKISVFSCNLNFQFFLNSCTLQSYENTKVRSPPKSFWPPPSARASYLHLI